MLTGRESARARAREKEDKQLAGPSYSRANFNLVFVHKLVQAVAVAFFIKTCPRTAWNR